MIVAFAVPAYRTHTQPVAARCRLSGIAQGSDSRGAGNNFATGAVCHSMPFHQTPANPTSDAARSAHFERYVLPHLDAAYGLARWLARNEHDAEDVLQEAMLRAYRYYDLGGRDNLRAWLLTIVRNTFYTLRKLVPAASLLDEFDEAIHGADDDTTTPESRLLRDADVQQVRDAVEQLPVEFREVLVLREFEECSYKDIVAITGLKMGTVMSRLARARERLVRQLHAGADARQSEGGQRHAMQ
jgi:RNA polymerase sigma-70 factor (ECF subfamily)